MPFAPRKPAATHTVKRRLANGTTKEYVYRRESRAAPKYTADSLGAILIAYRNSPEWRALKPKTQINYNIYLRHIEGLGALPAGSIQRKHIILIRNQLAENRGHGAANVFVRVARAFFTWAAKNDFLAVSPVRNIDELPGNELPAWSSEMFDRATALLPEHLRRVAILARYTGARRGDLTRLTWAAYDGRSISYRPEKGKSGKRNPLLVIPAHPVLRAELDAWRSEATSDLILVNTQGRPWDGEHLSHMMAGALKRAGLPPLGVHGLRKLMATSLAEAGCSAHEIAAITGHTTLAMVQHYTKSADQEALGVAAMAKLFDAIPQR